MASNKYKLIIGLLSLFSTATFAQQNDAAYDWRDSSKLSTKMLPQHSEFLNNQYPYPAKPRSQWELGLHVGSSFIIGDVDPRVLSSFGGGISLRKALSHVFSLRGQYNGAVMKGIDYRPKPANQLLGNIVPSPYTFWYGPNSPNAASRNQLFVPNYKNKMHQLAVDVIASLNTISHYRGNPKSDIYIFVGYAYSAFDVDVETLDNAGRPYNYNGINFSGDRKDIRERIKGLVDFHGDGAYESNAGVLNGHREDALPFNLSSKNWLFRHGYSFGGGYSWKLSKKINIGLEQRFTHVINGDDIDGINVGRTNDLISYTSGRLNINLGSTAKKVQPLWWINPNNFIYNELNAPQHMKLPKPILPDADGDGVTDQFDMEPNTPQGAPVDVRGVSRDTDGDGVPDYKDKELLTSQKCFPVDADGVGTCPEPACCKELRDAIATMKTMPPGEGDCAIGNLPSVQFKSGSATLSNDAKAVLAGAAAQIKANPTCKIKVTGYGASDKRAQQLSWDRVNAVIRNLVERQGIAEDRFIFSYGTEGDMNTVDLMGTNEEGPNTVPAPHPNLKKG